MTTAVLLVFLGAFSRLVPHPYNFAAIGSVALFSGARIPRRFALAVPLAAMAASDFLIDYGTGRRAITFVRLAVYGSFAAIVLVGRLAARTARPLRLGGLSIAGSLLFFLVTNFAVWASMATYPPTVAGLALCYSAAVPWFWNTLAGDLLGTALLFSLDGLARRSRLERAAAVIGLGVALLFAPRAACGQTAPVSETVVVTATAFPAEETEVGSAATVITRRQIEQNGWKTVADALRTVEGVEVARSGGPGAQTSVFLRGAASTQTLVLVDGVRVNSPFFPGYDFALLSTENVERIEVVRGPFSALHGSDAIGGVVQIFTRPAGDKTSVHVSAEAGNASQREATGFLTTGAEAWGVAASFRDHRADGDRGNDDWRERSGSARLEGRFGERLTLALEGAIFDGDLGLPGPVGRETPNDRYRSREERISLPATFHPAEGHTASAVLGWVASRPTFETTGFRDDTDARTFQARVSDSFSLGSHRITGFGGWERWTVDDTTNFGPNLEGSRATLWHVGAEDSARLGPALLTAGLRYDHHSQFGDAWSPRATLAWTAGDWKLRGSAGTGFRAPSVGELYYPFSGNPQLQPERSVSYDIGAEWQRKGARAEISLFWNDYRDLIVYDFTRNSNFNVGRARTRGVEVSGRADLGAAASLEASYTYLDAKDLGTGLDLVRRPRHQGSIGLVLRPISKLEVAPRAVLVGNRADFNALTSERLEDPGYVRVDVFARYPIGRFVPYARIENLFDRRYAEVDGFPAPRRRYAAGLEVRL
jgi:vitamin B12 transporter